MSSLVQIAGRLFILTYILSTSKVYSLDVNYITSTGPHGVINKNAKMLEEGKLWNEKRGSVECHSLQRLSRVIFSLLGLI